MSAQALPEPQRQKGHNICHLAAANLGKTKLKMAAGNESNFRTQIRSLRSLDPMSQFSFMQVVLIYCWPYHKGCFPAPLEVLRRNSAESVCECLSLCTTTQTQAGLTWLEDKRLLARSCALSRGEFPESPLLKGTMSFRPLLMLSDRDLHRSFIAPSSTRHTMDFRRLDMGVCSAKRF